MYAMFKLRMRNKMSPCFSCFFCFYRVFLLDDREACINFKLVNICSLFQTLTFLGRKLTLPGANFIFAKVKLNFLYRMRGCFVVL